MDGKIIYSCYFITLHSIHKKYTVLRVRCLWQLLGGSGPITTVRKAYSAQQVWCLGGLNSGRGPTTCALDEAITSQHYRASPPPTLAALARAPQRRRCGSACWPAADRRGCRPACALGYPHYCCPWCCRWPRVCRKGGIVARNEIKVTR